MCFQRAGDRLLAGEEQTTADSQAPRRACSRMISSSSSALQCPPAAAGAGTGCKFRQLAAKQESSTAAGSGGRRRQPCLGRRLAGLAGSAEVGEAMTGVRRGTRGGARRAGRALEATPSQQARSPLLPGQARSHGAGGRLSASAASHSSERALRAGWLAQWLMAV